MCCSTLGHIYTKSLRSGQARSPKRGAGPKLHYEAQTAMQMRWDTCACWKGASLSTYSMQYAYLIFDFFLSYSIQVVVIDIFPPGSKIFDPHLPQLPGFPLGLNSYQDNVREQNKHKCVRANMGTCARTRCVRQSHL